MMSGKAYVPYDNPCITLMCIKYGWAVEVRGVQLDILPLHNTTLFPLVLSTSDQPCAYSDQASAIGVLC